VPVCHSEALYRLLVACRTCNAIAADIDRLEAAGAFGGGGFNRGAVDVSELGPECAAAVAVLPGAFRQDGLLKSALKGYAGGCCGC
jgi:hypothetical protein